MKIEEVEKLVANLNDKTEYVMHINILRQALNHRLVLKKVLRVIKLSQNAWQKPYIDKNTGLRKKQKMNLKKIFLSLWILQFLEKLSKMLENIEILNFPQQKKEKTICCQNQINILHSFSQNFY